VPPGRLTSVSTYVDEEARLAAYAELRELAEWSVWTPLAEALPEAPRSAGVFLLLEPSARVVRHVGRAGERSGGGSPQGLYGGIRALVTGHAPLTGFAEAALDRALADPDFVRERVAGPPQPVRRWAAAAVRRLELDVSWTTCPDSDEARWLAGRVAELLRPHGLWTG
jgi:hypothetical protein